MDPTVLHHNSSLDLTKEPSCIGLVELGSCSRSARWCPDGKSVLTADEDKYLGIYQLPEYSGNTFSSEEVTGPLALPKSVSFRQASPIYDTLWFPFASLDNPATFCFLVSSRDAPVKLLDGNDGRLRASYRIVDHRERFVAPHSLAFNLTGQRFYCGFLDAIEVFDLNAPGEGTRLHTRPTKKSKDGLRGIVSALDFCPDYSGLFAAGTFTASIGLFSEDTGSQILLYLDDVPGPISQLQFHPTNPSLLFCSCRRRNDIFIWDVRNTSALYSSLSLQASSNQRMRFDIEGGGKWLVAGDAEGNVNHYNLNILENSNPAFCFQAHKDLVSTAAFHPSKQMLLTISGSRAFPEAPETVTQGGATDEGHSSDEEGEALDKESPHAVVISKSEVFVRESAMKLWSF